MTSTLSTLKRRLVHESAEIGVRLVMDWFLRRWDQGLSRGSSPPDPLEFFNTLARIGS